LCQKIWDVDVKQLGDEQLAPSRLAASLAAAVQESQFRVNESSRTPQYRHYQIEIYIFRNARKRALYGPRRDPTKMLDLQYRLPTNDTLKAPYANTYTRQAICMLTMWEELCQKVCNPFPPWYQRHCTVVDASFCTYCSRCLVGRALACLSCHSCWS
jgi:hypothetical protein